MFYLTMHSTHFILRLYGVRHMVRTIQIAGEETRCRNMGYSFRLTARVLLYVPSHRQDCTNHGLCYTSRGARAGMRNSSMGPHHGGSIQRPIAPWAKTLTTELHLTPYSKINAKLKNVPFDKKKYWCHILNIFRNNKLKNCKSNDI